MEVKLPYQWTPRHYQLAPWRYLEGGGKRLVLKWHRRCLAEGTMVTMADGSWAPIQTLKAGDRVLSWVNGAYCEDEVTNVFPAGVKPVVRTSCSGLPSIVSTADHRFHIRRGKHEYWKEIGEVAPKKHNGSPEALTVYSFREGGGFPVPHAELFGYLITDGSVNADQCPKFTNVERALIDRVCELGLLAGAVPRIREKGRGWDVGLSNGTAGGGATPNPIKELFRREGALGKRGARRIPRSMWGADSESVRKFFGSVIDGDGSLGLVAAKKAFGGKQIAAQAEVKIHAGESEALAWDYYWLLRKIGVVASRVSFEKASCWTVRVWTSEAVLGLLGQVILRHPAKNARQREVLDTFPKKKARINTRSTYVASIRREDAGIAETWDIETMHHARFFANGYLVHNSGKDDMLLHWTAVAAHQRVGNYWYMLPQAAQARKSMWNAINPGTGRKRPFDCFPDEVRKRTLDDEMMIELNCGSTFQLVGSDNFNSLIGSPPVGLVFSESAVSNPDAWAYLMPILEENGGWAAFNSTPRGKNHFKGMCELAQEEKDWFYSSLDAKQSGIFTEEQLARILKQLIKLHGVEYGTALFEQEYYVSFEAAVPGSIWGDCVIQAQAERRIGTDASPIEVPHTVGTPVFTGWDLGYDDETTCWYYQVVAGAIHVIDYHSSRFKDIAWECQQLLDRHMELGYEFGTHWLPHDARPATKAAGGKSMLQQAVAWAADHGQKIGRFAIAPKLDVQEGIQAARATFPLCRFDSDRCAEGVDHLKEYQREYDSETKTFAVKPKHDIHSHAADGWRTVAVTWRQSRQAVQESGTPSTRVLTGSVVRATFGEMKKLHFAKLRAQREKY